MMKQLICFVIMITMSVNAADFKVIQQGESVTVFWNEHSSNCDGCPWIIRPESEVFKVATITETWGTKFWDVGRDTTFNYTDIQENTGFYVLAIDTVRNFSSVPSDTVWAYVSIMPDVTPSAFFHDFRNIRDEWTFIGNHKDKDGHYCLTCPYGLGSMSLVVFAEIPGEYLITYKGWKYEGLVTVKVGDVMNEIDLSTGTFTQTVVFKFGLNEILISTYHTSVCFSEISSELVEGIALPATPIGIGIR